MYLTDTCTRGHFGISDNCHISIMGEKFPIASSFELLSKYFLIQRHPFSTY
jgi:hypothetical protein